MFDVIIVKVDRDHVTRYANEVSDTCSMTVPNLQIARRSIADTTTEKHTLKCKKLLFLLGNENVGMTSAVENWVTAVFPGVKDVSEKVLIVQESSSETEGQFDASDLTKCPGLRQVTVKTLKDVFQWWPKTIDFLFKKTKQRVRVYLTTDIEIKKSEGESESIDVEQGQLKDDIRKLLQFNRAELVDNDGKAISCNTVIVVFGKEISVSNTMYSSLRRSKINGVKVFFFFPLDVPTFDRKLKRISNYRFTVSQQMEGILFLMREIGMEQLELPPLRRPLIPTGPLSIQCKYDGTAGKAVLNAKWAPYPYGLGETISLQIRVQKKLWHEIHGDLPATKSDITVQLQGRPPIEAFDYRIMCEDKDGNLSNYIKARSINFTSTNPWQMKYSVLYGCASYKIDKIPAHVKCHFCDTEVDTVPNGNVRNRGKCWCLILGCFGCCCASKDVVHTCPNCQQEIRRYNGSQ
ncbi:uncharacterized protein LOC123556635 [Mercenaria mercenaria]|uniref:uncharacterized protein LOC123556635 n=1 Tax=Mercenaria mercenaria TaxID=6596 RepID=UPI00234F3CBB|nr:uncharacterized protein LOC123556635 [Mercenaria mercenaria]